MLRDKASQPFGGNEMDNGKQSTASSTATFGTSQREGILAALALLPLGIMLFSTSLKADLAGWQQIIRQLWLLPTILEIGVICIALGNGLSLRITKLRLSKPVIALNIVWLLFVLLTPFWASQPDLAAWASANWLLHVVFAASLWHLVKAWNADNSNWLERSSVYIASGAAAAAIYTMVFAQLVGIESKFDWVGGLPGFPHIRHFGYFALPAMALSLGSLVVVQGRDRLIHTVLLAVNTAFCIWVGSRGPLIAFAAVLPVGMLMFPATRSLKFWRDVLLALLAGALLSQIVPAPKTSSFNALARFEAQSSGDAEEVSSGRTEIWRDTARMISRQALAGYGSQQFKQLVPAAQGIYKHPHDAVLQFLFDWGMIGGGALLLLIAIACRSAAIAVRRVGNNAAVFALPLAAMFIFALIDGILFYNLPIMLTQLFLFGLLALPKPVATAE